MLLGIDLINAVDAHRRNNMERRRIGRSTRTLEEFVAHELGMTLEGRHHEEAAQLSFPPARRGARPPAGSQLADTFSARRAAA